MESWSNTVFTLLNEPDKKGAREDAGPDTEYEYWRTRLQRLNDIAEHLKQSDCQLIIAVLWTAKSSTMKRWTALVNEMTDALNEAKDNVKYLTSLEKYTECLYTGGGPPAVMEVLPALVNNIKMMITVIAAIL